MKAPGILKTILLLFLANYLESITAPAFIKIYVALPLTFLVFSGLVYKSSKNINPIYAFCLGIFVDLISNSLFGQTRNLKLDLQIFQDKKHKSDLYF